MRPAFPAAAGFCLCLSLSTEAEAAPACPSRDFTAFLAAFTDDVALQKVFVSWPVGDDLIDADAPPETKRVTRMLTADQMLFPLMPNSREQTEFRLKRKLTTVTPNEVHVRLYAPDTDKQITFSFHRKVCWMLYHIREAHRKRRG